MAKHSKSYGRDNSATGSSVSQTSKGQSFVVSLPLTPSEVGSLRRQSKYVNAVSLLGSRTGRNGSSRVSQTSKGQSFVVSLPLTPSEVGSLRRQSKYVNAVSLLGSRTGRNGSS